MRSIFYFIFFLLLFCCTNKKEESKTDLETKNPIPEAKAPAYLKIDILKVLNRKIYETNAFIGKHSSYNNKIAFLIDMRIPSNNYRFFIVNLQNNKIIKKGLVAHGINSNNDKKGKMIFSNEVNSSCTSLGKYLVGESYVGRFGKSYRLYGLESTNNNSIKRAIILHKYEAIPDNRESSNPICNSFGCPMVSPLFFNQLEKIIDQSPKKIILSIYY